MANIDSKALFKIGYGLYVVTTNDGKRDNGMICNTVVQVTSEPPRLAVTINKANYTHDVIRATGKMNVCTLGKNATFPVFEDFGFRSGRDSEKFSSAGFTRSSNGLAVVSRVSNSFFSLEVENYVDLGTHGMFICSITEAQILSDEETMTYDYYMSDVKPKPQLAAAAPGAAKRWICPICGYVYEGEGQPPADYLCPLCKHPGSEFVEEE
jgi:flavin reductase (DIM6/NTAB) family NADH-FMN oxidoreductase RutF/rubredoxin